MANENFNQLPKDVQEKAKDLLTAYNKVHVTYENGEYKVSTGIGIYGSYASDHKYIGGFFADEVFTPDERILNYFTNFHSFPVEYLGERDYKLVQEVQNAGFGENRVKVKLEDGNIVKV